MADATEETVDATQPRDAVSGIDETVASAEDPASSARRPPGALPDRRTADADATDRAPSGVDDTIASEDASASATAAGRPMVEPGRGASIGRYVVLSRLRVRDADGVPAELIAETRFVLARALWTASPEQGGDAVRARSLAEQARETYSDTEGRAEDLALVESWLKKRASAD